MCCKSEKVIPIFCWGQKKCLFSKCNCVTKRLLPDKDLLPWDHQHTKLCSDQTGKNSCAATVMAEGPLKQRREAWNKQIYSNKSLLISELNDLNVWVPYVLVWVLGHGWSIWGEAFLLRCPQSATLHFQTRRTWYHLQVIRSWNMSKILRKISYSEVYVPARAFGMSMYTAKSQSFLIPAGGSGGGN